MNSLSDLEKKINSELTTKINESKIAHEHVYLNIDSEDLLDVTLFLKTNKDTKFRQLIDITAVDYPENSQRFKMVYLFLSHEFNQRIMLTCLINENEICLFMKGTPDVPQCGFSLAVANMLKHLNVKFKGINVLENDEMRQGIKQYSDWPTIPQLYIKGEFVGGCDIVKEMFEKGELKELLKNKSLI